MEDQVERLVKKTWSRYQSLPPNQRLLVAVSGIPGSGKTTLAATVTTRLNQLFSATSPSSPPIAGMIPMDGYHLSRAQLSAMPDPTHAHDRRGAEFTFDSAAYLHLVKKCRSPVDGSAKVIYAPSFDHAVKDPKEDDIPIEPTTRILVFEGLYLSLTKTPWKEAAELMDETWFVDVDMETARSRLVPRHVKAGIAKDIEAAHKRVSENDLVNGEEIIRDRMDVDEVVISRDDDNWKPEAQGVGK
ncbi:uridine kinase [Phlyctema vagabunda]|uniref:Uridine kinase n=1 Tax=Phlyctema vagabunda TaxID=108571 RepID=A0ABR4PMM5_9HELO